MLKWASYHILGQFDLTSYSNSDKSNMSGIKTEYKHNHSGINKTKHKGMLYQLLMLGEKENCDWYFTCINIIKAVD